MLISTLIQQPTVLDTGTSRWNLISIDFGLTFDHASHEPYAMVG